MVAAIEYRDDDEANLEIRQKLSAGLNAIGSRLINQPAQDILDLAAAASDLFEYPELLEILRDALLKQASPAQRKSPPRPM